MAVVAFTQVMINPLADLAGGMAFRCMPETASPQLQGENRQYGTRLRGVSTSVIAKQSVVPVRCDNRTQIDFLKANQGLTVCYRHGPLAVKFYAVYWALEVPEQFVWTVPRTVTLTVNEVTQFEDAT